MTLLTMISVVSGWPGDCDVHGFHMALMTDVHNGLDACDTHVVHDSPETVMSMFF